MGLLKRIALLSGAVLQLGTSCFLILMSLLIHPLEANRGGIGLVKALRQVVNLEFWPLRMSTKSSCSKPIWPLNHTLDGFQSFVFHHILLT